MALNEQMRLEAIKEAEAIDSGKDARTKKEMLQEQMEGLKTVGKTVVENIPGVGEAILAKDIAGNVSEGNYASAALGTAALVGAGEGAIAGAGTAEEGSRLQGAGLGAVIGVAAGKEVQKGSEAGVHAPNKRAVHYQPQNLATNHTL